MRAKEKKYFRQKLLEKRAELISVVQKTEDYGRQVNTEAEGMDLADKASSSYTKEFMFSKSDGDRQLLQEVVDALRRLDDGDFGKCMNCEEEVERKRLEAVPWSPFCLSCQAKVEANR
ncbi:MAG: TraR/DksA family transcriptional regulator [Acidobacteria bacterium]|nr:TraR/DksA family transcriptional regulator [Acidobacteriota bacterium]